MRTVVQILWATLISGTFMLANAFPIWGVCGVKEKSLGNNGQLPDRYRYAPVFQMDHRQLPPDEREWAEKEQKNPEYGNHLTFSSATPRGTTGSLAKAFCQGINCTGNDWFAECYTYTTAKINGGEWQRTPAGIKKWLLDGVVSPNKFDANKQIKEIDADDWLPAGAVVAK
ncbi:MAG TPA: hypothetical protein VF169_15005 [Albitalea sp.]|uniref:hypothetical protein n=1 Tax=Piscinibacter sp. TaxID=1903157 RepID=UPI002ED34623